MHELSDSNASSTVAANGSTPTPGLTSVMEMLNVTLRHRRLIALVALACAGFGIGFALLRDPTYVASATFMPQRESASTEAAMFARQFGFSIGSTSQGYSADFYANLIQSRAILRPALQTTFEYEADGSVQRQTLLDALEIPLADPDRMWSRAERRLRRRMNVSVERVTQVVTATVTTSNPALSEQVLSKLLELVNEFNLAMRRNQALEETRFTDARLQEAAAGLDTSETALKRFLEGNRNFQNSPELVFEHDRLQRQVLMRQETYTMLAQSLERGRMEAARDVPVLTIVDRPEGSAQQRPNAVVMNVILGLLLGMGIGVTVVLVLEFFRRSAEQQPEASKEFVDLRRAALEDLRRPHRIFRAR